MKENEMQAAGKEAKAEEKQAAQAASESPVDWKQLPAFKRFQEIQRMAEGKNPDQSFENLSCEELQKLLNDIKEMSKTTLWRFLPANGQEETNFIKTHREIIFRLTCNRTKEEAKDSLRDESEPYYDSLMQFYKKTDDDYMWSSPFIRDKEILECIFLLGKTNNLEVIVRPPPELLLKPGHSEAAFSTVKKALQYFTVVKKDERFIFPEIEEQLQLAVSYAFNLIYEIIKNNIESLLSTTSSNDFNKKLGAMKKIIKETVEIFNPFILPEKNKFFVQDCFELFLSKHKKSKKSISKLAMDSWKEKLEKFLKQDDSSKGFKEKIKEKKSEEKENLERAIPEIKEKIKITKILSTEEVMEKANKLIPDEKSDSTKKTEASIKDSLSPENQLLKQQMAELKNIQNRIEINKNSYLKNEFQSVSTELKSLFAEIRNFQSTHSLFNEKYKDEILKTISEITFLTLCSTSMVYSYQGYFREMHKINNSLVENFFCLLTAPKNRPLSDSDFINTEIIKLKLIFLKSYLVKIDKNYKELENFDAPDKMDIINKLYDGPQKEINLLSNFLSDEVQKFIEKYPNLISLKEEVLSEIKNILPGHTRRYIIQKMKVFFNGDTSVARREEIATEISSKIFWLFDIFERYDLAISEHRYFLRKCKKIRFLLIDFSPKEKNAPFSKQAVSKFLPIWEKLVLGEKLEKKGNSQKTEPSHEPFEGSSNSLEIEIGNNLSKKKRKVTMADNKEVAVMQQTFTLSPPLDESDKFLFDEFDTEEEENEEKEGEYDLERLLSREEQRKIKENLEKKSEKQIISGYPTLSRTSQPTKLPAAVVKPQHQRIDVPLDERKTPVAESPIKGILKKNPAPALVLVYWNEQTGYLEGDSNFESHREYKSKNIFPVFFEEDENLNKMKKIQTSEEKFRDVTSKFSALSQYMITLFITPAPNPSDVISSNPRGHLSKKAALEETVKNLKSKLGFITYVNHLLLYALLKRPIPAADSAIPLPAVIEDQLYFPVCWDIRKQQFRPFMPQIEAKKPQHYPPITISEESPLEEKTQAALSQWRNLLQFTIETQLVALAEFSMQSEDPSISILVRISTLEAQIQRLNSQLKAMEKVKTYLKEEIKNEPAAEPTSLKNLPAALPIAKTSRKDPDRFLAYWNAETGELARILIIMVSKQLDQFYQVAQPLPGYRPPSFSLFQPAHQPKKPAPASRKTVWFADDTGAAPSHPVNLSAR